ncbi:MAG: site-2 protease family protein [Vicinamibacteria bacterium]|nr:site-2 protease family protein [Vicinamibacteria bacterium]
MSSEPPGEIPERSFAIDFTNSPAGWKRFFLKRRLVPVLLNPSTNVVLFMLTALSITFVGGWRMSVALMSVLLAHEMGHYFACRRHGVSATLPFFIPAPILFSGTLGALILMRDRIPNRKALFDIGIAGPLAGFLVCLPVLAMGAREATIDTLQTSQVDSPILLGDPLLLNWTISRLHGDLPSKATIVIGPLGLAAWFGLFLTALNLIPVGQLDGGHILYSVFRDRAHWISRLAWWICVALIFLSPSWILWVVLLRVLGRRHPPTLRDEEAPGAWRKVLALAALAIFILCFIPEPIVGGWDLFLGRAHGP